MKDNDKYVKDLLDPILDVFSGADGGVSFCKMRSVIKNLKDTEDTDRSSTTILGIIEQFSKLSKLILEDKI